MNSRITLALVSLVLVATVCLVSAQDTTPADTQKTAPPIGPTVKPGTLEPAEPGSGTSTPAEASPTTEPGSSAAPEPSAAAPAETKTTPMAPATVAPETSKPSGKPAPKMAYTGADLPLLWAVSAILVGAGLLVIVLGRRGCRRVA